MEFNFLLNTLIDFSIAWKHFFLTLDFNLISYENYYLNRIKNANPNIDEETAKAFEFAREVNEWIYDNVWFYVPYKNSFIFLAIILKKILFYVFISFLLLIVTTPFVLISNYLYWNKLFTRLATEFEQGVIHQQVLKNLIFIFLVINFFTLGSFLFTNTFLTSKLLLITGIVALCMLVMLITFFLLLNWGFYAPIYVKGQSVTSNIIVELATDILHLFSFFLRIYVQLIRIVIISGVFYTYSLLYQELNLMFYTSNNYFNLNTPLLFNQFFEDIAHILFEVGHTGGLIAMQAGAFILIVLIITQFLYTTYLTTRLMIYFYKK